MLKIGEIYRSKEEVVLYMTNTVTKLRFYKKSTIFLLLSYDSDRIIFLHGTERPEFFLYDHTGEHFERLFEQCLT